MEVEADAAGAGSFLEHQSSASASLYQQRSTKQGSTAFLTTQRNKNAWTCYTVYFVSRSMTSSYERRPIPNGLNILDIATEIDLSPIQPRWIPLNVKFIVDDIETDWAGPIQDDDIHCR
ncbi:unnamed protein product [Clonostachys chloroleuca]|uniref:Uncharacterized protein n=1 Tax=Clonostachys chloroleuca TaxID=1926264 RepID=A0AA35M5T2_9HYPO|nr:unnamed protein product [Clonostachys chloroleuca]